MMVSASESRVSSIASKAVFWPHSGQNLPFSGISELQEGHLDMARTYPILPPSASALNGREKLILLRRAAATWEPWTSNRSDQERQ